MNSSDRRVLVVGSSGMAGHVIALHLTRSGYRTFDIGPRKKVFPDTVICDIFDRASFGKTLEQLKPDVMVNCIGVLVERAERCKAEAAYVNAYFPHFLSEWSGLNSCKVINISTDCVFSGSHGPYFEDSHRDGDSFYDRSKALGELVDSEDLTIRTSIVGPELSVDGIGLFNWFMGRRGRIDGFGRVLWSGITTMELARFIERTLRTRPSLGGLIHYSIPDGISKYALLSMMNEVFGRDLVVDRVETPVSDKRLWIKREDCEPCATGYREQLIDMREWIRANSRLYPWYELPPG